MNPRTFSDDPKFIPFLYVLNQLLLKTSAVTALNSLLFLILEQHNKKYLESQF